MGFPVVHRVLPGIARRAERRLPSLTRLRARETLPVRLDRRRIYIVPTVYGFVSGLILLVMLLGALNYNNNAALLLSCVLGATGLASMLQTFRTLDGLRLRSLKGGSAFAGEPLVLDLSWDGSNRGHHAVVLDMAGASVSLNLARDATATVRLEIPTARRGWMEVARLRASSRWPFGWFRAWSWLAPAQRVLVYPRLEPAGPPPPPATGNDRQRRRPDGDEWAGLREYRSGDPRRLIAWKASARGTGLRVKTFDAAAAEASRELDWERTALADPEARISRLARWVHEAHREGHPWSLRLPGQVLPAGTGTGHYRACLQALAELP